MIEIGRTSELEVSRETKAGYYLSDGEEEVLLPGKLAPDALKIGDKISVFAYTDSEDRPVATTQVPLAQVGDFALLKVVDENGHGAFLDWGLDKDLFVPLNEQFGPMVVGQSYVVAVYLDNVTNRVAAASKLGEFLDYDVSGVKEGQPVELLVYGRNEQGTLVIVDDRHSGIVYRNETFTPLALGQRLSGFVLKVRDDNRLDIRLRAPGVQGHKDAEDAILKALKVAGGVLPLGDKSPPEKIAAQLGLSKKAFKAAIGSLYKAGQVVPGPLETRLSPKKI